MEVMPKQMEKLIHHLPKGKANAIKSYELQQLLGFPKEQTSESTRFLVGDAITLYGLLIGSTSTGFYLIECREECEEYIESLKSRQKGLQERIEGLEEGLKRSGLEYKQGRLF